VGAEGQEHDLFKEEAGGEGSEGADGEGSEGADGEGAEGA